MVEGFVHREWLSSLPWATDVENLEIVQSLSTQRGKSDGRALALGQVRMPPGTCTSDWHHQVRGSTVFCTWPTRAHMQGSSARAVLGRAKEKESVLEGWPRSTDASLMPTRHLTETRIGSRGTPCGSQPIFPMLSHHLRTAAQLACSSPPT